MKTPIVALLTGVILVPFMPFAGAVADPTSETVAATDPAAATPAATGETGGIEPIVVTAERQESVASKTPIALTVLSGTDLYNSGITDPSTLRDFVPNFAIDPGNENRISIRGITSFDTTPKGDPSAAFMLDGVYIARSSDTDVTFFDLARIEVLRGPQGTLYGRNSTAGVVNVISNRPTDTFEAGANATVGDFGTYQADGFVNMPVADWLSLRASVAYDRRDSYLRPDPGDPIPLGTARDDISTRLQGLISFSQNASLLLKFDYRNTDADSAEVSSVLQTNFFNISNPAAPQYINRGSTYQRTMTFDQAIAPFKRADSSGISAEFNWDLGPLTLTYLGSYRDTRLNEAFTYYLFLPAANTDQERHVQDSQELRFAIKDLGPIKAQFGAYYFREDNQELLSSTLPPGFGFAYFGQFENPITAKSNALFGQATYDVTTALHLTAGLRYTHDDKSQSGGEALQLAQTFNPATDILTSEDLEKVSFSKTTWRGAVDYDLNDHSLVYASVSTGYKSGGFNSGCLPGSLYNETPCKTPVPADTLFYRPETVTAYEIGAKLLLADNTLQLNAATFYYDYTDLQLQSVVILNGAPAGEITNAAKARDTGVELDALYVPDAHNRIQAAFTYLDAHYVDFFPLGVGNPPSYAGRPLDNAPRYTFSIGYTYSLPVWNNGNLDLSVYSKYTDDYVVTLFSPPTQFQQPTFTKTDLTVTYRPNERWHVQAFARNLENKIQITSAGPQTVNISEPRTFGMRAGFDFR